MFSKTYRYVIRLLSCSMAQWLCKTLNIIIFSLDMCIIIFCHGLFLVVISYHVLYLFGWRLGYVSKVIFLQYSLYKNMAPPYLLLHDLQWTDEAKSLQRLRSGSQQRLIVPRTCLRTIFDRTFRVTAARAWNSLPTSVTTATFLAAFKRQFTTFHKVLPGILVCVPYPRSTFAHATLRCTFLTDCSL